MTHPSDDTQRPEDSPAEAAAQAELAAGLEAYYQPFYNLRNGRLQGLEALARHRSPQDGHAETPADFFAAAAAAGRMRDIDLWVLREAVAQMAQWRSDAERHDLILSVNLSEDFACHVLAIPDLVDILTTHRVPGDRFLVDVTVDTFRRVAADPGDFRARLRDLQEHEIAFCLDNFTLADLDLLPTARAAQVDIVKVHPRQILSKSAGGARAMSDLAAALQGAGLPAVAAGVETRDQLDLVRDLGFEWAQGFLLGQPQPADRVLSISPRYFSLD